jgi:hypothetical protein
MSDGKTPIPVSVDPATGAIIQEGGSASLPSTIVYGQQAVTATAAALPSAVLTQGVIITALSTNVISIFVGGVSVTDSTGVELQPGAALSVAISNLNKLYVIASTTGATITWIGS